MRKMRFFIVFLSFNLLFFVLYPVVCLSQADKLEMNIHLNSYSSELYVPLPDVPPLISRTYSNDRDGNLIDDILESNITSSVFSLSEKNLPARKIDIELIFDSQITQNQIDEFTKLGGEITYIYKSISYGWDGRIAQDKIKILPSVLGSSLVLISQPKMTKLNMDVATRTGRVRPIWKPGFANNILGFDGDENMTIGIIDSGIDANHPDFEATVIYLNDIEADSAHQPNLEGRYLYWQDFSPEKYTNPVDFQHHGSSVVSVAWGTGLMHNLMAESTNAVYWTDYSEPNAWWCGPYPASLPDWDVTLKSIVYFTDTNNDFVFGTREYIYTGEILTWLIYKEFASGTVIGPTPVMSDEGIACAPLINGAQNTVITNQLSPYYVSNDGFSNLRGVAPECRLACAKIKVDYNDISPNSWTCDALDSLIFKRKPLNLRVINISSSLIGDPGLSDEYREQINSAVCNGIVVVSSAGNDGIEAFPEIDDPGRAALALTVGASNDKNQLTEYSSRGFSDPCLTGDLSKREDYKPDLIAPGGSNYCSYIMSVDSGSSDGFFWDDMLPYDYGNVMGTSLSAPFVTGCAALVIDALQQKRVETGIDPNDAWDFYSSNDALFVKMVLCATATETNEPREDGNDVYAPTLQRAERGPMDYPEGKDPYEGYGIINPDAAVEAVYLTYQWSTEDGNSLGPDVTDRRAWARQVSLWPGETYNLTLVNPFSGDFDLYLYSGEPNDTGTPQILACSTNPGLGFHESISFTSLEHDDKAILVVKRIEGSGEFRITPEPPPIEFYTDPNSPDYE